MIFAGLLDKAAAYRDSSLTIRAGLGEPFVKSFAELVGDVRRLGKALTALGVKPGHYVGLQAANCYEFIVWDLALIELRAVPHVFPEDWSLGDIRRAADIHGLAFSVSRLSGELILPASGDLSGYFTISPTALRSDDPNLLTQAYSSGTSGRLKGLIINRLGVEDVAAQFIDSFAIGRDDRHLYFLPMSHFQQRLSLYTCLWAGVSVMLTPYTHVFHDIPQFQPTFLIAPPVFYEVALATLVPRDGETDASDRLHPSFGGKLRFMITGMSPIRSGVRDAYLRYGLPLVEAYGMTEIGLIAWNSPGDNQPGTVGRPLRNHRVSFGEDSEILVQALHPFSNGYFDVDADEASRTFLPDGRIATGDIGEMNGSHLTLRGRIKDVIVTSEGLKFHPSSLEERVLSCELVRQAAIVTDIYRHDILVVLSVDDPHSAATISELNRVVANINASGPGSLRIARTIITRTRFAVDNGMLTRNMKPNRMAIAREFSTP